VGKISVKFPDDAISPRAESLAKVYGIFARLFMMKFVPICTVFKELSAKFLSLPYNSKINNMKYSGPEVK
jgi:hypothetical protein